VFFSSKCVRCTPLINTFGSKSRTLRQQNSRLFCSTSLAHFYRPSILVFVLQLKDLISENIKISI